MTLKQIVKAVLPPVVWSFLQSVRRRFDRSVDCLTYAPDGWATKLPNECDSENAWAKYMAQERRLCETLIRRLQDGQPVLVEPDGSVEARKWIANMTYVYVLALTARQKSTVKVLDYGGNLGDYYWLGQSLLPGVDLEYHCKELPAVAEEGRKVSPQVTWHIDDSCLNESYDMVMFSASLQYIQNWKDILCRAAAAVQSFLFLSQISTVECVPGYVALQRIRGLSLLHQQLNRTDVLETVRGTGLRLVREFLMCEHLGVANAPEQPSYRGWLFQRDAGQA